MIIGELPESLTIDGDEWDIRTDFRDILKVVICFDDPELDNAERIYICLRIIYKDFDAMPEELYEKALEAAVDFIDCGIAENKQKGRHSPRTMDWEQDSAILFAAVNKAAGIEVRSVKYMHWWTFMGYFMEIPADGVFGRVMGLRHKKSRNRNLDKYEREFWESNKGLCVLKPKLTEKEKAAKEQLNNMLK